MKKLIKIFNGSVFLLLSILLLVGCTNDENKKSTTVLSENNATSELEHITSSEIANSETNVPYEEDDAEKKVSIDETEKENSKEEANSDENDSSKNIEASNSQSTDQNTQIKIDTDENDKEKAISLVKGYLSDRNELIEDEKNYVQYDGEINDYVIIRYSTLVSGHSSTNGRYAVDINSEEVVDIIANPEVINK